MTKRFWQRFWVLWLASSSALASSTGVNFDDVATYLSDKYKVSMSDYDKDRGEGDGKEWLLVANPSNMSENFRFTRPFTVENLARQIRGRLAVSEYLGIKGQRVCLTQDDDGNLSIYPIFWITATPSAKKLRAIKEKEEAASILDRKKARQHQIQAYHLWLSQNRF